MLRMGVDTGGTFTDIVLVRGDAVSTWKQPSTPDDPSRAILEGLRAAMIREGERPDLVHGSTVATNALLEGKTARIAFVTNRGFEDLLEIGRQARPELYNLEVVRPPHLAPRELRFGLSGRLDRDGAEVESIDAGEIRALAERLKDSGVEAAAVCLLHSYIDGSHEEAIGAALEAAGLKVSLSARLVPEYREYERASTAAVNAAVSPIVERYLQR